MAAYSGYTKALLSGSTNGRGIKVVATATPGTTIHTATSSTTAFDESWIYAYNGHTSPVELTIEFGGVSVPDDNIIITLPSKGGRFLICDGRLINNSLVIKAFASVANVVVIDGFVNQVV
jgi:hypothetical protein